MRLGLIARGDQGGLAAVTIEAARHLGPARILLVDLGPNGRGPCDRDRYAPHGDVRTARWHGGISDADYAWLCDGSDVIYTVEVGYHHAWVRLARSAGIGTVQHVMPELDPHEHPDVVLLPTTWEVGRYDGVKVLPVPVAGDRLPFQLRGEARTFLHVSAPAMLDRNGSDLVFDALPHVQSKVRLLVRGNARRWPSEVGQVTVEQLPPTRDYWDWPDADVLILPRRYGGLSLPMQEAAARGMPTISLTTDTRRPFLHPLLQARGAQQGTYRMKGGMFAVHGTSPGELAATIDRAVRAPELIEQASARCGQWREENTWQALDGQYRDAIDTARQKATAA